MGRVHGPSQLSVRAGLVTFESRPMKPDQAARFARMLNANRRVSQATVHPVQRRHMAVVCWLPADPAQQQRMFRRYQGDQEERARTEMDSWCWRPDPSGRFCHVETQEEDEESGEVTWNRYRVADDSCTCPHFKSRCRAAGVKCKHICAWLINKAHFIKRYPQGENYPPSVVPPATAPARPNWRKAELEENRLLDFG